MRWEDRIIIDQKILMDKPIIKGTRISVEFGSKEQDGVKSFKLTKSI